MIRHATLAAFLVTVVVVVPTAWHRLDADIQTDGKKLRPLQQSFTIDGTKVTIDLDRGVAMTGSQVTATLVAYGDTPKPVVVDLTLHQSHNYTGDRVESPEVVIDHEKLTLHAAPDGGPPVQTRLVLGKAPALSAMVDNFRIYVAPHDRKALADHPDEPSDGPTDLEAGRAAAIGVIGWSGDSLGLAIVPEGPITSDQPFVVAVRVKNTSGQALPHPPSIHLGTRISEYGSLDASDDFDIESAEPDKPYDEHEWERKLKRGGEEVERFTVTPKHAGLTHVTFVASAFAWDGQPGPVIAGAMDARTFPVMEHAPAVVAVRRQRRQRGQRGH